MVRLAIAMLLVVAYVAADENACEGGCECGSVCNAGACVPGCRLYDKFMTAGMEDTVYGRKCRCGDVADDRGMLLECEEGVEFVSAPNLPEWENNPSCAEPAPATVEETTAI